MISNQAVCFRSPNAIEALRRPPTAGKRSWTNWASFCGLLLIFVTIQLFLPLRTAVKIGADEDYELSKVELSLKGYKSYTEIWNDQPLLHTFIVTEVIKNITQSVLAARLVTSVFAAVLLASVFFLAFRISGMLVAIIATALLIASPGFVELSGSCMVEIPALAPAVAGLAVLVSGTSPKWRAILAGALFGVSFQIKFINLILLPLAALIIWSGNRSDSSRWKRMWRSLLILAASLVVGFVAIGIVIGEGSFWLQLKQSWASHFASTRSFEYGLPADRPFDWSILLKNWDTTVPAILGIVISLGQLRRTAIVIVPAAWCFLALIVFGLHKPWWSYYYIHNAVPLCWCAAIGIVAVVQGVKSRRTIPVTIIGGMVLLAVGGWAVSRVYLQVSAMRNSPKLYSSLVLKEIERFRPFTKFIYTDEPVYSFHAHIPMPPHLAVVSLKRFWSGDMTNARLVEELGASQPELILLRNDTRELPFDEWLVREYRLVYQDQTHRLHAHFTIVNKPE